MSERVIFGIDLGGTTAKLGLFSENGVLLEKWQIPTDIRDKGKNILRDLAASVRVRMSTGRFTAQDVIGIGLGVPGEVLQDKTVEPCVNLNGWGGFYVAGAFSRMCGIPVKAVNDANAAALGELWKGSAQGARNMYFVAIGTGLGAALVIGGQIVEGFHGAGGEIGHMIIKPEEKREFGRGKRGRLEQYASASGIACEAKQLLETADEPSLLRQYGEVTAKHIFMHAQQGDALARRLTEKFASELGRALSIISCVCDPEVIVLGGGVSAAGDTLLSAVKKAYKLYAPVATEGTVIRLAALGNDAGIFGAARLMMK
ncbi:MAG: ROK family protein [Clostridiales bacterium]|nr:ROK family protein [Clostridiales bacterium]